MADWQPIETFWALGPEEYEGCTVLIYSPLRYEDGALRDPSPIVTVATYEYAGPFTVFDPDSDEMAYAKEDDPTHWMPLPNPPVSP